MHTSYASNMLAIRRVRWPYAGHTLAKRRVRWPYTGHMLVICYSYATHKFNTVSLRTILYLQGHFMRMKIILCIFIRNSFISLIHNSVTGP